MALNTNNINQARTRTAILAAVCLVLQVALAPNFGLGNGRCNFMLVFAACTVMLEGGTKGIVASFVAGLVFDLTSTTPVGVMSLLFTIFAYVAAPQSRNRFSEDPVSAVQFYLVAETAITLVYSIVMLMSGVSNSFVDAIFLRALPTIVLNAIAFAPFMFVLSRGTTSKYGGKAARRTARHFSTKGL